MPPMTRRRATPASPESWEPTRRMGGKRFVRQNTREAITSCRLGFSFRSFVFRPSFFITSFLYFFICLLYPLVFWDFTFILFFYFLYFIFYFFFFQESQQMQLCQVVLGFGVEERYFQLLHHSSATLFYFGWKGILKCFLCWTRCPLGKNTHRRLCGRVHASSSLLSLHASAHF